MGKTPKTVKRVILKDNTMKEVYQRYCNNCGDSLQIENVEKGIRDFAVFYKPCDCIEENEKVSDCCGAKVLPPDWDKAEQMGSLWRAYTCYICKECGFACKVVDKSNSKLERVGIRTIQRIAALHTMDIDELRKLIPERAYDGDDLSKEQLIYQIINEMDAPAKVVEDDT